jgi:heme exporter protein B
MSVGRVTMLLVSKDLRLEARGRHALNLLLPFSAATLVVFGLTLGPGRQVLQTTAPALLWVTTLYATLLGARNAFDIEEEDGALTGLLLAPVDKGAVFLGKTLALALMISALQTATGVMALLLFGLQVAGSAPAVLAGFVLGSLGLAAVGALFSALVVSARAREALLPVLVLPVTIPVALAGIRTTALGLAGGAGVGSWLAILAAFDVVFVAAGLLLFVWVLED